MAVHPVSHHTMHTDVSCITSVMTSMHSIVAGSLRKVVVDSMRIRLLLLQDHKINACNVAAVIAFMLAIYTSEQLSWRVARTVSSANCNCVYICSELLLY